MEKQKIIVQRFKCDSCNIRFPTDIILNLHMKLHENDNLHKCDKCKMTFASENNLSVHKKKIHTDKKPFNCVTLEKTTNMSIPSDGKPFPCNKCEKSFSLRFALVGHMQTHTAVKSFQCTTCEKQFTRKFDLQRHEKIHTGERPSFKCQICDKSFSAHSSLTVHIRIHTGSKPYSCDLCQMKFYDTSSLMKHKKSAQHVKKIKSKNEVLPSASCSFVECESNVSKIDKTFSCGVCDTIFESLEVLNNHKFVYHKPCETNISTMDKTYSCEMCNKNFKSLEVLNIHKNVYHKPNLSKEDKFKKEFSNNIILTKIR